MAAYSEDAVEELLLDMGFQCYDNSEVYRRSREDLTYEDNDYVAYTIAYQEVVHPVSGETYAIYCVPIQGTPTNAEWFSDFNLGYGDEHEGFKKASTEIYNKLRNCFMSDAAVDSAHRIVWFAGHSRGAACANLLAGWFSDSNDYGYGYTTTKRVFAYTYACPAVSLKADTTLENIYNFNNDGDLIPLLPLEIWGYKRNGQSILLDNSALHYVNFMLKTFLKPRWQQQSALPEHKKSWQNRPESIRAGYPSMSMGTMIFPV